MTLKPFLLASALALAGAWNPASAEPQASAAELTAPVALLPGAAVPVPAPQTLDDVDVAPEVAPGLTPAQRRAANRKAREELLRRFGPSIHVFN